jgi:RecJ-like exonuclease
MINLTFTHIDDNGDEEDFELPAKHEVCPRCEGHGTHLHPDIGSHAYSAEEFAEEFHDDDERAAYFKRGGRYDVPCEECHGKRVVVVVDEAACRSEDDKRVLKLYFEQQESDAAYAAQRRAERRMGY